MLDEILEAGSMLNWIGALGAFAQDLAYGPSHTLLIPSACGWRPRDIGKLLDRHGVRFWGMMIVNHELMITVKKAQARWADYLIRREGIPLLNPIAGGPSVTEEGGAEPPAPPQPSRPRRSWGRDVSDALDRISDVLR